MHMCARAQIADFARPIKLKPAESIEEVTGSVLVSIAKSCALSNKLAS